MLFTGSHDTMISYPTTRAVQFVFPLKDGGSKSVTIDMLRSGPTSAAQLRSNALGAMVQAGFGQQIDADQPWPMYLIG